MHTQQQIEQQLWYYIDGTLSEKEKTFIEQLLQTNEEWKLSYAELLDIHQLMQSHLELEEPSMRFRQNVMEAIAINHIAPATKSYLNKKIIWSIGGFFVIMLTGFVVYAFAQVKWNAAGTNDSFSINMAKLDVSRVVNNSYMNIFIMVNVVLGLMLLDMYLNSKRRKEMRS